MLHLSCTPFHTAAFDSSGPAGNKEIHGEGMLDTLLMV